MIGGLRLPEIVQMMMPGFLGLLMWNRGKLVTLDPQVFIYFGVFFVHLLFSWTHNDYCDYELDRLNPRKTQVRTKRELGILCLLFLSVSFAMVLVLPGPFTLVMFAANGVWIAYSMRLKRVTPFPQLVHLSLGALYFCNSFLFFEPDHSYLPSQLVGATAFFSLLFLSANLANELIDSDSDSAAKVRTLVNRLGKKAGKNLVLGVQLLAFLLLAVLGPNLPVRAIAGASILAIGYLGFRRSDSEDQRNFIRFRMNYRYVLGATAIIWAASLAIPGSA